MASIESYFKCAVVTNGPFSGPAVRDFGHEAQIYPKYYPGNSECAVKVIWQGGETPEGCTEISQDEYEGLA